MRDPLHSRRMAYCGPRGIPIDEFLRWPVTSQEAALDWQAFEARRCKHCGTHPDEWADDKLAYHAHLTECVGCRQLQRLSNTEKAKKGDGVYALTAGGSAAACPQCKPMPIYLVGKDRDA